MNDTAVSDEVVYVIPYTPREHFEALHNSPKRWKFVCAHRRAGKSVAEINETIRKALENTRKDPPPRYAYVGPSFDQTKDLIWGYLKHYTSCLPGVQVKEGDLEVILPTGASIKLYGGAAAYERMRGMYFDGIVLDEFPLLNPAVFSTVVRPCLADYRGWAIISGTSNGDDHFSALRKKHIGDAKWDMFIIPITQTNALHPDEVVEMTEDMSPEEYAREMMCSFEAPVEGAYYSDAMNKLALNSRITKVPYDPSVPVVTWWDLGIDDFMTVWFIQIVGRELHVIGYKQYTGKGLDFVTQEVKNTGYSFSYHIMPHDIRARELSTARSRLEIVYEMLGYDTVIVAPSLKVEDGIAAVRTVLPMCWFDEEATYEGLSALRNYHKNKSGLPVHNWASHGADGFRYGAVSLNMITSMVTAKVINRTGGLRRRIRGV